MADWSDSKSRKRIHRMNPAVQCTRKIALKNQARRPWTREEEKLLGTRSDKQVAQLLKRHINTVGTRRRQLNIPHFIGRNRDWTVAEERLLGTMPDKELAHRLGRTLYSIRSKRILLRLPRNQWWTTTEENLLGRFPDEEVSRRTGRTVLAARLKRQRLGIPSPRPR